MSSCMGMQVCVLVGRVNRDGILKPCIIYVFVYDSIFLKTLDVSQ